MTWSRLVENKDKNHLIDSLNEALQIYNEAYKKEQHSHKQLLQIISICDAYIQQAPKEKRINVTDGDWDDTLAEWPYMARIVEIQKNAVRRLYLPSAKNDTQARFQLIRELVAVNPKKIGAGKLLEQNYWEEFRYQGQLFLANWIKNNSSCLSYDEVMEEAKSTLGVNKAQVRYFNKSEADNYAVTVKSGLLYFQNELLDSSKTVHENIEENGRVIFACARDGTMYVSDPNEKLKVDFHHSSFLKGKPALCAGSFEVKNGKIVKIYLDSGHYKPNSKNLYKFLLTLKNIYQVDLKDVVIVGQPYYASESLKVLAFYYGLKLDEEKKAEHVLATKGFSLAASLGNTIFNMAWEAKYKKDIASLHHLLDKAIAKGNLPALIMKATLMVKGEMGYDNKEEGLKILQTIYSSRQDELPPHVKKEIEQTLKKESTFSPNQNLG